MKLSDKNKLFQYLSGIHGGLNDFTIADASQAIIEGNTQRKIPLSTIIYKKTPLHFEISNPFETFDQYSYRYTLFGPNYQWSRTLPIGQVGYFNDVVSGFQLWISTHIESYKNEMSEIDLWGEYTKVPKSIILENDNSFDSSQFTNNEKGQLKLALSDLKRLIIENFANNQSQIDLVSENINYIASKVDSLSKFDWRSVTIAVLINISTGLMLDPEKAKLIWDWFVSLVSSIPQLPI